MNLYQPNGMHESAEPWLKGKRGFAALPNPRLPQPTPPPPTAGGEEVRRTNPRSKTLDRTEVGAAEVGATMEAAAEVAAVEADGDGRWEAWLWRWEFGSSEDVDCGRKKRFEDLKKSLVHVCAKKRPRRRFLMKCLRENKRSANL
ncbi:hypothetical protein E3N88_12089 [Mikania micrantha]|uniref:Uncharacterized protein n=1 Tax=Mikania micrantha TaxID=192012 RepID=A0A5N6P4I4_9ASTR|nr:hypothetical protein E3N88_12089 [Mikania micrantha]